MLNPKFQRYATRLQELIEEGKTVAALERPSSVGNYIQGEDLIPLNAWLTKTNNIIYSVFGPQSSQYKNFMEILPKYGIRMVEHSYDIYPIIGVLAGALNDLENGYLIGQEFLIAGEVFDSILEQAKELIRCEFKDPAAILVRVIIEDSLKRIARREEINDSQRASAINDELKKKGVYSQHQWRIIQVWLDIGNNAAHGKFNTYAKTDIEKMINEVEQFLVTMSIS